jgi:hypothetical protein
MTTRVKSKDANRDPLTGEPGAHPVGTGIGAAVGGAAAGAATGTIAGPVGTAVGAAMGAIVGGLAGKAAAEKIDPTVEEEYWRENFTDEPYYQEGLSYDHYAPAYQTGYEGRAKYEGRAFEDVEGDLERDFDQRKGTSILAWDQARSAAHAAWHRDRSDS